MKKITILGDGGWGTALALTTLQNNTETTLWGPFEDNIEAIRTTRKNRFLPGVDLPENLKATSSISEAVQNAEIVVLASPMYYWGFSGQLKTAFDRLFAVAECFPGYANPHKECALIMAAEGNSADNWKPVLDYYHALLGFLGWQDRGQILAGGVFETGAVAGQPVLDQAFRFGASL